MVQKNIFFPHPNGLSCTHLTLGTTALACCKSLTATPATLAIIAECRFGVYVTWRAISPVSSKFSWENLQPVNSIQIQWILAQSMIPVYGSGNLCIRQWGDRFPVSPPPVSDVLAYICKTTDDHRVILRWLTLPVSRTKNQVPNPSVRPLLPGMAT